MSSKAMVIAPGEPVDRTWWDVRRLVIYWIQPRTIMVTFDQDPLEPAPVQRSATLRRWRSPSWIVTLPFFLDDRLTEIPAGYVMPGDVFGVYRERCRIEDKPQSTA